MADKRLNPTLFDKLVTDLALEGLREEETSAREVSRATMRFYTVPRIERFNEAALRATVKRELNWLLNTTHLAAAIPLERYPQVRSSVLNYGVPDLAGKSLHQRTINMRAREIRDAVRMFEPRLDPQHLEVEPRPDAERPHAVTYIIRSDITAAVRALPVEFITDVEQDSAAVVVRE